MRQDSDTGNDRYSPEELMTGEATEQRESSRLTHWHHVHSHNRAFTSLCLDGADAALELRGRA